MIIRPAVAIILLAICASCTTIRFGDDAETLEAERTLEDAMRALEDVDMPRPERSGSVFGSIASVLIRGRSDTNEIPPLQAAAVEFVEDKLSDGADLDSIWSDLILRVEQSLLAGRRLAAAAQFERELSEDEAEKVVGILEEAIVRLREHRDVFTAVADELASRGAMITDTDREMWTGEFSDVAAEIGRAANALVEMQIASVWR
ncbi:MAG: hypothetical protein Tsb0010_15960 [Parvularculaceae bacterium]